MGTEGSVTALAPLAISTVYELFPGDDYPGTAELRASATGFRQRALLFFGLQAAVAADDPALVNVGNSVLRFEVTANTVGGSRNLYLYLTSLAGEAAVEAATWTGDAEVHLGSPVSLGVTGDVQAYTISDNAALDALLEALVQSGADKALMLRYQDDATGEVGFVTIDPSSIELDFDWFQEPDDPTPGVEYTTRYDVHQDGYIVSTAGDVYNASGITVQIAGSGAAQTRAFFEKIDMTSPRFGDRVIPAEAVLSSVTMHKYCTSVGTTGQTHAVREVLAAFDCEIYDPETGITYGCTHNSRTMVYEGEPTFDWVGDAAWTTAGALGSGTDIAASDAFTWANPGATGAFTRESAEMLAFFQSRIGTTISIKHNRLAGATSSQYGARNNTDETRRPYYEIVWSIPASDSGAAAAAAAGVRGRGRGRTRMRAA
jgi:hypothetical protein